MMPQPKPNTQTLDERWLHRLRNNPIIAAIIVVTVGIAALLSFWNQLPSSWTEWVRCRVQKCTPVRGPETGWVFAGYIDPFDEGVWTAQPRLTILHKSDGLVRPYIIREGDIVQTLRPLNQVIANFASKGTANQLIPPAKVKGVIDKSADYTGLVYGPGTRLEVLDVSVGRYPGRDYAVWLRVQPDQ